MSPEAQRRGRWSLLLCSGLGETRQPVMLFRATEALGARGLTCRRTGMTGVCRKGDQKPIQWRVLGTRDGHSLWWRMSWRAWTGGAAAQQSFDVNDSPARSSAKASMCLCFWSGKCYAMLTRETRGRRFERGRGSPGESWGWKKNRTDRMDRTPSKQCVSSCSHTGLAGHGPDGGAQERTGPCGTRNGTASRYWRHWRLCRLWRLWRRQTV